MDKLAEFENMGGRSSLIAINKVFYDKVYAHPWLKQYFEHIPQQHIEDQQVDFMQKVLGGPNKYAGKAPPAAHMHIFITEEIFKVRKELLEQAFKETNADIRIIRQWLTLDESFKRVLIKNDISACKRRFNSDDILHFPKPNGYKA